MKHFLFTFLLGGYLVSSCTSSVESQETNVLSAREMLMDHKPLLVPSLQVGATDPQERKTARSLFAKQIKALHELSGSTDASLIPIMIPFLHYTNDNAPTEVVSHEQSGQSIEDIAARYPAFAVIVHMPTAGPALSGYISNTSNSLEYRLAAFHVLRYVNRDMFDQLRLQFDKEFVGSGHQTKSRLKAIEQENAPFEGIDPVDLSQ